MQGGLEQSQRAEHINLVVLPDVVEARFGGGREAPADAGVGDDEVEMGDSLGPQAGYGGRGGGGVGAVNV